MTIFHLPDLGEGLPDAEIHEWFVKEGDIVKTDQPLVSMETAKAVVDVPCPQDGIIGKLHGKPGDVIITGDPLMTYQTDDVKPSTDKGTVVGNLEESTEVSEDNFTIGTKRKTRASAQIKMLAKKLNVNIKQVPGTGEHGVITRQDVQAFADEMNRLPEGFEPLKGVRRAMLSSMVQSHQEVVPVSIFDEADISNWPEKSDITVRLIRAVQHACKTEPALNAWFNTQHGARKVFDDVHLGLAMDSPEGLFVPVIHSVNEHSDEALRETINRYKTEVQSRSVAPENLKGGTITLSNFGKFAGRFASPIIVPPMVAIIAVGRLYQGVVAGSDGKPATHPMIPLSLSFDHRAVTGGEATRFLGAVIESLQSA